MTIECYFDKCQFHSSKNGCEEPLCYEERCKATVDELENFRKLRYALCNHYDETANLTTKKKKGFITYG